MKNLFRKKKSKEERGVAGAAYVSPDGGVASGGAGDGAAPDFVGGGGTINMDNMKIEILRRLARADHELPKHWQMVTDGSGKAKFIDSRVNNHTEMDPRYLPASWELRMEKPPSKRFYFANSKDRRTCYTDPRGMPEGWRMRIDAKNRGYFVSDELKQTSYTSPLGLPHKWKLLITEDRREFFADSTTKDTYWDDPRDQVNAATVASWALRDFEHYILAAQARTGAADEVKSAGEPDGGNVESVTSALKNMVLPDDEGIPDELLCSITMELMVDPVLATDGHTYERAAIEEWLTDNDISPKTGAKLPGSTLIPNFAVRALADSYKAKKQ